MSDADEHESPEQEVKTLFELAKHAVSQAVGPEPGTVDWFATPLEGFVRPKTYWRVWQRCPRDLEAALEELERARQERHADRALAVVMKGKLPPGFKTNIEFTGATAITVRRLALELSGVAGRVRAQVAEHEHSGAHRMFLPLQGRTLDGETRDVIDSIEAWAGSERRTNLILVGPMFSGQAMVIDEAVYQAGKKFISDPEVFVPIVLTDFLMASETVFTTKWAVYAAPYGYDLASLWADVGSVSPVKCLMRAELGEPAYPPADPEREIIELVPPDAAAIEQWFRERLDSVEVFERFIAARRSVPDFADLSGALPNISPLLNAMRTAAGLGSSATLTEWVARVVEAYMVRPCTNHNLMHHAALQAFEDAALEQFALGQPRSFANLGAGHSVKLQLPSVASTWTKPPIYCHRRTDRLLIEEGVRLENRLVHHYFLARKLAREVRNGNIEILTRRQFPREYVLLFLAILAPEVAAEVTAERSEALRAQIESEVERRLQLTLAHALKRSAGAVRSHMKTIRRHIEQAQPSALLHELARVEEETAFQCALAEQTRLWHEVPESAIEGLSLSEHVRPLVDDLREEHPSVACEVSVAPTLRVRASRDVLREILSCLLENAFQAAAFADGLSSPRVRVRAFVEGETVRLDVLDNGPGVAEGDRERVFDLYVTTKKGGGKPLGTGMGLPIARRYAEQIGSEVGLDPERPETCFFVRFVAWMDVG